MRKKLFAIVMSMTMVASFMPSLAFAAVEAHDHDYTAVQDAAVDNPVEWSNVQDAVKDNTLSKYVNVTKEPTCTEKGEVEITCTKADCYNDYNGHVETFEINATNHAKKADMEYSAAELATQLVKQYDESVGASSGWTQEQADAFLEADASAEGGDGHCYYVAKLCPDCKKIVDVIAYDAIAPSTNIKYVAHDRNTSSKCNTKAACLECGKMVKVTGVPAPHDTSDDNWVKVTEATCEAAGTKGKVCKVCGEVDPATVVADSAAPKLAHNISAAKVSKDVATTDGTTLKKGYFKVTGTEKDEFGNVTAVTDYYKVNAVAKVVKKNEASHCTEVYQGVKCSTCGKFVVFADGATTYDSMAVAAGESIADASLVKTADDTHDFETVKVSDATCTAPATEKKVCKDCGYTEGPVNVEGSKALGHDYSIKEVAGDCNTKHSCKITCSRCDITVTVEKTGDMTAPRFSQDGDKYYFKGFNAEFAPTAYVLMPKFEAAPTKGAHAFATSYEKYKDADCVSGELWVKKCKECGKIDVTGIQKRSNALGHDFVKKAHDAATCVDNGTYVEQCSRCNVYKTATAELYTEDIANAKVTVDPEAKPLSSTGKHTFDKWVVTKAPSVFEKGVETLECSVCGADGESRTAIDKLTVAKASNTVKAGKKSFNVKSSAANATGYRVYYKKAGAKSWKSYTKKTASLSKTFSGLSKGKYYVKVKAYAKNYAGDGEVVWGATSSTKSVKVK